jgi:hypothetical protein
MPRNILPCTLRLKRHPHKKCCLRFYLLFIDVNKWASDGFTTALLRR